jgi:hypothetical protein
MTEIQHRAIGARLGCVRYSFDETYILTSYANEYRPRGNTQPLHWQYNCSILQVRALFVVTTFLNGL